MQEKEDGEQCPLVGPWLGQDGPNGEFMALYGGFAEEKGKLCWDFGGLGGVPELVRVADWQTDEYWGERVLVVSQMFPRGLRGLAWQRRQSQLRLAGVGDCSQLSDAQAMELALKAQAMSEAQEISEHAQGCAGRKKPAGL